MKFEIKDMAVTVDVADNPGQIEGYASVFGEVDNGGDIVAPGAYARSLSEIAAKGRKVKMLWQHNPEQPIGVWDEVREDEKGLFVKGRILMDLSKGREAAAMIEAGAIDGLSIGYRTVKATKNSEGNRVLQDLELWEVSLVTFPMLESAIIGAKKSVQDEIFEKLKAGDRLTEREFETLAKGLGLSNSQAERAARIHLKGQGEPAEAVQSGDEYSAALLALMA